MIVMTDLDMSAHTETDSSESSDTPPDYRPPNRTETEISMAHGTRRNDHWRKRNLLSLGMSSCPLTRPSFADSFSDGGGIRGYWTLLVLKRLMELIYHEEKKQAQAAPTGQTLFHSFWPQKYPEHVSQLPEEDENDDGYKTNPASRMFLPCHYFDFICGSSTGGYVC